MNFFSRVDQHCDAKKQANHQKWCLGYEKRIYDIDTYVQVCPGREH